MSIFKARVREITSRGDDEIVEGGTLGVWMSEALLHDLQVLSSTLGISRSACARELLAIAVPQAMKDAMDADQLDLELLEARGEDGPAAGDVRAALRDARAARALVPARKPARKPVKAPGARKRRAK